MSEFHENKVNFPALGILLEAFSLVLEDSKANAGLVAVNELLNDPQRAERTNSLGFVQLLEQ
jgi:hypothetical protein